MRSFLVFDPLTKTRVNSSQVPDSYSFKPSFGYLLLMAGTNMRLPHNIYFICHCFLTVLIAIPCPHSPSLILHLQVMDIILTYLYSPISRARINKLELIIHQTYLVIRFDDLQSIKTQVSKLNGVENIYLKYPMAKAAFPEGAVIWLPVPTELSYCRPRCEIGCANATHVRVGGG